jgi:hypothetical protein
LACAYGSGAQDMSEQVGEVLKGRAFENIPSPTVKIGGRSFTLSRGADRPLAVIPHATMLA